MPATDLLLIATLAVIVHSLAMLVVTGITALCPSSQGASLDILRRDWIDLDLVWSAALIGIGFWLVLS